MAVSEFARSVQLNNYNIIVHIRFAPYQIARGKLLRA
jgi:hypothetical protein